MSVEGGVFGIDLSDRRFLSFLCVVTFFRYPAIAAYTSSFYAKLRLTLYQTSATCV